MNQNYQTRISPQICKVQTDRKLIAVYDQLKCADTLCTDPCQR